MWCRGWESQISDMAVSSRGEQVLSCWQHSASVSLGLSTGLFSYIQTAYSKYGMKRLIIESRGAKGMRMVGQLMQNAWRTGNQRASSSLPSPFGACSNAPKNFRSMTLRFSTLKCWPILLFHLISLWCFSDVTLLCGIPSKVAAPLFHCV